MTEDPSDHEAEGAMLYRGIVERRQEDMVRQLFKDEEEIKRLRAEVERLAQEKDLRETTQKKYDEYFERAISAERKVAKLREALKEAVDDLDCLAVTRGDSICTDKYHAVLEETEKNNG